jgi:hypothetical protein
MMCQGFFIGTFISLKASVIKKFAISKSINEFVIETDVIFVCLFKAAPKRMHRLLSSVLELIKLFPLEFLPSLYTLLAFFTLWHKKRIHFWPVHVCLPVCGIITGMEASRMTRDHFQK